MVAVNGVAAGAGASLAMACDIAIAAPDASFVQAFSKIGLIPDAGGSWLLVERLGLARAMALAMTGDKLPAAQAKEWGLIWDVADDPLAAAMALADKLAIMPTKALVATRQPVARGQHAQPERAPGCGARHAVRAGRDARLHRGCDGVPEKRPPQFKGA